jgi:integrase
VPRPPTSACPAEDHRPAWFEQFLADRGTRKPSVHTLKAYRQDFDAIAALLAEDPQDLVRLPLAIIDTEAMRSAFAEYARSHQAASIRRCWSTWNVLCTFLFTAELIPANPMPMIGRPKQPKALPKSLPPESVTACWPRCRQRRSDPDRPTGSSVTAPSSSLGCWPVCAPTNCCAPTSATCAAPRTARSCGSAARRQRPPHPRRTRPPRHPRALPRQPSHPIPADRETALLPHRGLAAWPASAPLFVGGDGQRITRGTLQYRALRAFRQAGIDSTRTKGALLHGLRHTFATELANADTASTR